MPTARPVGEQVRHLIPEDFDIRHIHLGIDAVQSTTGLDRSEDLLTGPGYQTLPLSIPPGDLQLVLSEHTV